jgi:hypothetical protein
MPRSQLIVFYHRRVRKETQEFRVQNLELEGTFTLFHKVIALADERIMEPLILRECKRVAA